MGNRKIVRPQQQQEEQRFPFPDMSAVPQIKRWQKWVTARWCWSIESLKYEFTSGCGRSNGCSFSQFFFLRLRLRANFYKFFWLHSLDKVCSFYFRASKSKESPPTPLEKSKCRQRYSDVVLSSKRWKSACIQFYAKNIFYMANKGVWRPHSRAWRDAGRPPRVGRAGLRGAGGGRHGRGVLGIKYFPRNLVE